jgi:hypothetical protein
VTATPPRTQRRSMVLFGIAVAGIFAVALAFRAPANERPHLGRDIATVAAAVSDGGRLDLAKVADFPWDRVHVFLAYSSKADISESLGFDWVPVAPIQDVLLGDLTLASDELTLMVFVRGEREVTGWTVLNSEDFDKAAYVQFDSGDDWAIVSSRDEAAFVVKDISGSLADPRLAGWLLSRD